MEPKGFALMMIKRALDKTLTKADIDQLKRVSLRPPTGGEPARGSENYGPLAATAMMLSPWKPVRLEGMNYLRARYWRDQRGGLWGGEQLATEYGLDHCLPDLAVLSASESDTELASSATDRLATAHLLARFSAASFAPREVVCAFGPGEPDKRFDLDGGQWAFLPGRRCNHRSLAMPRMTYAIFLRPRIKTSDPAIQLANRWTFDVHLYGASGPFPGKHNLTLGQLRFADGRVGATFGLWTEDEMNPTKNPLFFTGPARGGMKPACAAVAQKAEEAFAWMPAPFRRLNAETVWISADIEPGRIVFKVGNREKSFFFPREARELHTLRWGPGGMQYPDPVIVEG